MRFADQPLSELAINIPMSTALFRRNRLDFCCGGKETLRNACAKLNLNVEEFEQKLEQLITQKDTVFESMPLSEMTNYIIKRYHEDLRHRFPELMALAEKVERVHADKADCPKGLNALLTLMFNEIQTHMMKEENVLFPMIRSGTGSKAIMPITVMNAEHESHGRQLDELHRITSDFKAPEGSCGTWRALYSGLEKLEEELMDHIHLENNILFPRALKGES